MKKNFKTIGIFIAVILGLLLLIFLSLQGSQNNSNQNRRRTEQPIVDIYHVNRGSIVQNTEITGEVIARNVVAVVSTVDGIVTYAPFNEGDYISGKGIKLIELEHDLYQREVAVSEASLRVAQSRLRDLQAGSRSEELALEREGLKEAIEAENFNKLDMERIKTLVDKGALAQEEYDRARLRYVTSQSTTEKIRQRLRILESGPTDTELDVQIALVKEAETRLRLAKIKLDESIITSPISGKVLKTYVKQGDMAKTGSVLLDIIDESSMVARFTLSEKYFLYIKKGTKVVISPDAYSDTTFISEVLRVYPEIDPVTRHITVEAAIPRSEKLLSGMFVRINVTLQSIDDALIIPRSAKILKDASHYVFTLKGSKAMLKEISIGVANDQWIQAVKGLSEDATIIKTNIDSLKDGMEVKIASKREEKP